MKARGQYTTCGCGHRFSVAWQSAEPGIVVAGVEIENMPTGCPKCGRQFNVSTRDLKLGPVEEVPEPKWG